ncbi:MAG TPA: class I SAM-dependent methyltransferase [Terriglobales bacterium]|nr:class I SAM-dependent methyltransferase [Terriglobales bacterium]
MDTALANLLAELSASGAAHDAVEADHGRRRLNLEPETARLIAILLRTGRRTRVLEIGTSNGYSTIWLAWAVRDAGGTVTSVERDAGRQAEAADNLRRAGLLDSVRLVQGDATRVIAGLAGPFDCVFFDADRVSAPEQLRLLLPRLTTDVLLLADNVHSHPAEIAGYLAAVEALPGFERVVVPVGKGLSVAHRAGLVQPAM